MTTKNILIGLGILVLIGLIIYFAKGRDVGNNDAANVNATGIGSWLTSDDTARGISFKHPAELDTKYITLFDWPPQVAVVDGPLSCINAGTATSTAGETKRETINSREYCVTKKIEGAAGTTYTQYAYASEVDGRVAILTFSTRAPQCANYNEPQRAECEAEMRDFNIGRIIDQIFGTLKLGEPSLDYEKG